MLGVSINANRNQALEAIGALNRVWIYGFRYSVASSTSFQNRRLLEQQRDLYPSRVGAARRR